MPTYLVSIRQWVSSMLPAPNSKKSALTNLTVNHQVWRTKLRTVPSTNGEYVNVEIIVSSVVICMKESRYALNAVLLLLVLVILVYITQCNLHCDVWRLSGKLPRRNRRWTTITLSCTQTAVQTRTQTSTSSSGGASPIVWERKLYCFLFL